MQPVAGLHVGGSAVHNEVAQINVNGRHLDLRIHAVDDRVDVRQVDGAVVEIQASVRHVDQALARTHGVAHPEALSGRDVDREGVAVHVEVRRPVAAVENAEVAVRRIRRGVARHDDSGQLRGAAGHVAAAVAEASVAVGSGALHRQHRTVSVAVARHVVSTAGNDANRVLVGDKRGCAHRKRSRVHHSAAGVPKVVLRSERASAGLDELHRTLEDVCRVVLRLAGRHVDVQFAVHGVVFHELHVVDQRRRVGTYEITLERERVRSRRQVERKGLLLEHGVVHRAPRPHSCAVDVNGQLAAAEVRPRRELERERVFARLRRSERLLDARSVLKPADVLSVNGRVRHPGVVVHRKAARRRATPSRRLEPADGEVGVCAGERSVEVLEAAVRDEVRVEGIGNRHAAVARDVIDVELVPVQVDDRIAHDVYRAKSAPVAVRRERHATCARAERDRGPRRRGADGERERRRAVDVNGRVRIWKRRRGQFRACRVPALPVGGVGKVRHVAAADPVRRRRPSGVCRREGVEALRRVLHPARARERGAMREVSARFKLVRVEDAVRLVEERALAVRLDDGHEVAYDHAGVLQRQGVEGVFRSLRDGPRAEHGKVKYRIWLALNCVCFAGTAMVDFNDVFVSHLEAIGI